MSIFALSRMGFAILFLSTRLSTEGYIDLLEQTACKKMVVSSRYTETAQEIQASYPISIYDLPTAEDYATEFSRPACTPLAIPNIGDRVAFIIHSSGSIGLPKPIYQTNSACLSNYAGGIPHNALLTLPLFHNHGLSTFFRALSAGRRIALYNANLPLSGSTLTEAIEALKPGSLHCVPYALKLMAESERGVEALKSCKLVLFGGSSCPDDLGDQLVAAGVFLVGHYGAYVALAERYRRIALACTDKDAEQNRNGPTYDIVSRARGLGMELHEATGDSRAILEDGPRRGEYL